MHTSVHNSTDYTKPTHAVYAPTKVTVRLYFGRRDSSVSTCGFIVITVRSCKPMYRCLVSVTADAQTAAGTRNATLMAIDAGLQMKSVKNSGASFFLPVTNKTGTERQLFYWRLLYLVQWQVAIPSLVMYNTLYSGCDRVAVIWIIEVRAWMYCMYWVIVRDFVWWLYYSRWPP